MRVCYFGTYDLNYSRNRIIIEGLSRNGVDVVECHAPLWQGTRDKVVAAQLAWRQPSLLLRAVQAYGSLLRQTHRMAGCDALVLGYMGQFDAFPARLVANRLHLPLILDVFMSISLIIRERRLAIPGTFLDRLVGWVERRACDLADMVWLDTPLYVDYFHRRYQLPRTRFRLIPTGADDRYYFPVGAPSRQPDQPLTVSYVGKYIPLHGVATIIQAASRLRHERIQFEMIGEGHDKPWAMALAKDLGAHNVKFEGWIDKSHLARRLSSSDICLGVFGHQRQGLMTVPNKIYEGLAMQKPVITGQTPAAEAAFESGRHLLLVPLEDPVALADAIRTLRDDPVLRDHLATEGYGLYREHYTPTALGALAVNYVQELLDRNRTSDV